MGRMLEEFLRLMVLIAGEFWMKYMENNFAIFLGIFLKNYEGNVNDFSSFKIFVNFFKFFLTLL